MKQYNHPIRRGVLTGCLSFILLLCVLQAALSYFLISRSLYDHFNEHLENIVVHVEHLTDADDLRACVESGERSAHLDALQQQLNVLVDDFRLQYLYIIIPLTETGTMVNVVSATSETERAAGEANLPLLFVTDAYPEEELAHYRDAWNAEGITYFEETSDYGPCYTACLPLRASDGTTVALVCADLAMDSLRLGVRNYVLDNLALTVGIGLFFSLLLFHWLRREIIDPVLSIEKSAKDFAEKSRVGQDPEELVFRTPDVHTGSELQSLADAISEMAVDMSDFARGLVSAEQRAKSAEETAVGMSQLAYQDTLTRVKSKAAYDDKLAELERDIADGRGRFAIVMMDVNRLKKVNDTFGHEYGDKYLIGSCRIISAVYKHSPVYRIGGDEFTAVLQGQDYANRTALLELLTERFRETGEDTSRPLYERYSVAAGMAEYMGAPGETAEQVFRRADETMYHNKQKMQDIER